MANVTANAAEKIRSGRRLKIQLFVNFGPVFFFRRIHSPAFYVFPDCTVKIRETVEARTEARN